MNAGHTPGPWYITGDLVGGPLRIREESSDYVLATSDDGGHVDPQFALDDAVIEANANLIAAAPDLLAALSDLMENPAFQTAIGGNPNMVKSLMERAWSAIAKARGEVQS